MEKLIEFSPAFDKRHDDPSKNYGIHGAEMRFVLKGKEGAVQFLVFLNWHLPHINKEGKVAIKKGYFEYYQAPMPADLGYHSVKPMYEGDMPMDCPYTSTGKCYYGGSTLNAEPVWNILVEKGSEAVWEYLHEYYDETFITTIEIKDETRLLEKK